MSVNDVCPRYRVSWTRPNEPSSVTVSVPRPAGGRWYDTTKRPVGTTMYMYLDESGDFDFGQGGSPYFIMSCAVTRRPFEAATELSRLRFDLLESSGFTADKFHACEDRNPVRAEVFRCIAKHSADFSVYAIRLDKRSMPEAERNPRQVYSQVFEWIVGEVCRDTAADGADLVVVITDDLPVAAKKAQVVKPLKRFMKQFFEQRGTRYVLLHHKSCSDPNLQVVDYLCWAYQKRWVHGSEWPYNLVKDMFEEVGEACGA